MQYSVAHYDHASLFPGKKHFWQQQTRVQLKLGEIIHKLHLVNMNIVLVCNIHLSVSEKLE